MWENDIKMGLGTILWRCKLNWIWIIFNGGLCENGDTPLCSIRHGVSRIDELGF
jgi:hypothetical protein